MMSIIGVQGVPFLACLAMLGILGYIGIHVLKREIIFIDIALAQIAAVGAISAHVIFHFHGHSIYAHALALSSTLIAAAFFAIVRRRIVQIPLEAVIGVSYAVSAAAALFLVGVAPGGHVHIHEMLAGSILWATWNDVVWSTAVFAAVGLCFYLFRKPFRLISENYDDAIAQGYNAPVWDFLFYALVGVVITLAVRIAGVVVVFAFLIMPATLSATFAAGWSARLLVAWLAGAVSSALGLLFAARFDFSVGPAIALFLGASLIVVGLLRSAQLAKTATAVITVMIAVAAGVLFAAGTTADNGNTMRLLGGAPEAGSITHSHAVNGLPHDAAEGARAAHHETEGGDVEGGPAVEETIDPDHVATLANTGQLVSLYDLAADAEERSMIACRLLDVDVRAGLSMAVRFLEGDPPLLFRLTVVDKLEEVSGETLSYNIDEPFTARENQEVIAELRKLWE